MLEKDTKELKEKPKEKIHSILDVPLIDIDNILKLDRNIYLFEEVDYQSAERVIRELYALAILEPHVPIKFWINSPGGSCVDGLAIIDCMQYCSCPIATIITGSAGSMAGIISICGNNRFMTSNSYWMGHPLTAGSCGNLETMIDRNDFIKNLNTQILAMIKKRTRLNKADFHKFVNGELWLNSGACLEKRIVDYVMPCTFGRLPNLVKIEDKK